MVVMDKVKSGLVVSLGWLSVLVVSRSGFVGESYVIVDIRSHNPNIPKRIKYQ
jgi:hypothetical protein